VIRFLADSSHVIQCNALSSDEANDQSILYMLQFLFSNSSRTATASSTLICLMKTCGCDDLIPSCYLKLGSSMLPLSTGILLEYGSVAFVVIVVAVVDFFLLSLLGFFFFFLLNFILYFHHHEYACHICRWTLRNQQSINHLFCHFVRLETHTIRCVFVLIMRHTLFATISLFVFL
jgi:hypothetical protein